MEENQKNIPPNPPANPGEAVNKSENCEEKNQKLSQEIEKIKKRQKFFRIAAYVMGAFIIIGFLAFYWVYQKMRQYYPIIQAAQRIAVEGSQYAKENQLEPIPKEYVEAMRSNVDNARTDSLSMIKFSQDLADSAANMSEEEKKEMQTAMSQYSESPEVKEMIEDLKKDPELKKMLGDVDPSNPAAAMSKMNDPKVMKKIMEKMMSRPDFMMTMMKMAADPKVMGNLNSIKDKANVKNAEPQKKSVSTTAEPSKP